MCQRPGQALLDAMCVTQAERGMSSSKSGGWGTNTQQPWASPHLAALSLRGSLYDIGWEVQVPSRSFGVNGHLEIHRSLFLPQSLELIPLM